MDHHGLFIVFEGIDGAGKTSQLKRTKEYLESKGRTVTVTREPGGTPIGEKIRGLLLDTANAAMDDTCELLLYGASRRQHIAEVILPALSRGDVVLCDRFSLSTAAYQGYGRGIDLALIAGVNKIAAGDIVIDRTYVFDVPVEVSAERVRISRGDSGDRLEQENSAFFDKVRHGFLQEAAADKSIVVVDGTQKESVVFDSIQKDLEQLL